MSERNEWMGDKRYKMWCFPSAKKKRKFTSTHLADVKLLIVSHKIHILFLVKNKYTRTSKLFPVNLTNHVVRTLSSNVFCLTVAAVEANGQPPGQIWNYAGRLDGMEQISEDVWIGVCFEISIFWNFDKSLRLSAGFGIFSYIRHSHN